MPLWRKDILIFKKSSVSTVFLSLIPNTVPVSSRLEGNLLPLRVQE
jgi:hypothetical protein